MKSRRTDHVIPSSMPSSPIEGMLEYKNTERGALKSRIPQMMSPAAARRRTPPNKAADCHSCETTRPKSASTRPSPAHPSQLLQGVRQNRAAGKDRPPLKRPSTLPKMTPPFRPPTPVIKVPITAIPRTISGHECRDSPGLSTCSNDNRSETNRRDSKCTVDDRRRMQLRMRWQENIAKFESIRRQLYEKQRGLLELYAILRSSHKELSDIGQNVSLPSSEELKIMNVAKLGPGQLLQLCAGTEVNELVNPSPPIDMNMLNDLPKNIVITCEKTLDSRKEIINWFEDIMSKKMITKNILVKKIKEFKTENEEFKRALNKNKEDYMRFIEETCENFKKSENDTLANQLRFQSYSAKLAEMNAVTEELRRKLLETEQELVSASEKSKELEKELKDEKYKKRDHISKADIQVKSKEDKIAQLTAALEQANCKSCTLEKTVSQLREENQKMQSNYDKQIKKLNESVDINTKLFDEIIDDRSKLLTEKQDLEKQLSDLCSHYEDILHTSKHETNSSVARLIETEKKYNDVLEEKEKLEDKVQSLCAQLLESELRFKEVSKKFTDLEDTTKDAVECRNEMETLICQLASANKELMEYKEIANNQKEAMKELEQNWNKVVSLEEQSKHELTNKEKYILELETQRSLLEQRLRESELKSESHSEELSNLRNHINQLLKGFGEFESWEELHEMVKQQNGQLKEAIEQNSCLNEVLSKKEIELQQLEKTITDQRQLIEEREATVKMLMDKNEEQSNIIALLRNNLEARTQADIEFNQQIAEKNTEIESLMSSLEKRKQQISQLEKIILTLEMQTVKLSHQKRTAREAISSLEKKLSEYESYYMVNAKNTESSAENLDDLINILEYELTNPSEGPFNCNSREYVLNSKKLTEFQSKRGIHNFKSHTENNSRTYQSQENVHTKRGMSRNYVINTNTSNEDKHRSDGKKLMESSEFAALPKSAVSATAPIPREKSLTATVHQDRNGNYCFTPNSIRDERKIKMFRLAGHRLQ